MKAIKLLTILFFISLCTLSCSKDDATQDSVKPTPINYSPFGYFQGKYIVSNTNPVSSIKLIFVFENEGKLFVGFNETTLTNSLAGNTCKGTYTVSGNKIFGTFLKPDPIENRTYSFVGDFDPLTAKFSGTIGKNTNTTDIGTLEFDKKL